MKHGWKRLGKGCVSMHLQAALQGTAGNRIKGLHTGKENSKRGSRSEGDKKQQLEKGRMEKKKKKNTEQNHHQQLCPLFKHVETLRLQIT